LILHRRVGLVSVETPMQRDICFCFDFGESSDPQP
jgi:hypothetical protein